MNATRTIDLTPTWAQVLPALIVILENPATRGEAIEELGRMADIADKYVELMRNKAD
jgi:hypothetical protein